MFQRLRHGCALGALVMAVIGLTSCDSSDEETGPYDCAHGSVPDDAHCFEFQGQQRAFRYSLADIAGFWSSTEFETCIAYSADGTGVFHYWGIVGSVPRDDSSVKWGVWVDADGDPVVGGDGRPVVVNHLDTGPALDRRLVGLGYDQTSGFGGDFIQVSTCPENRESNQGAITFFTTNTTTDAISIGLDSFVVGDLEERITGDEPDCGVETNEQVLTVYRQPGTYRFQALSSTATWGPTLIQVEKGGCTSHNLQ